MKSKDVVAELETIIASLAVLREQVGTDRDTKVRGRLELLEGVASDLRDGLLADPISDDDEQMVKCYRVPAPPRLCRNPACRHAPMFDLDRLAVQPGDPIDLVEARWQCRWCGTFGNGQGRW